MKFLDLHSGFLPDTFGSASFLGRLEAIELGLAEKGEGGTLCPYVGALGDNESGTLAISRLYARAVSPARTRRRDPRLGDGSGHLLTVAPTRAGKGTGQIIPNLLSWNGSAFVIDIKGENYKRSAGYRQREMGQRVLLFAPFEEYTDRWNPIMSIRSRPGYRAPEEEEDARYLTNLLIESSGSKDAEFFENSAKNFLEGLLLHVRTAPIDPEDNGDTSPEQNCQVRERSMREVRRLLTLDRESFNCLLVDMEESDRPIIKQSANSLARLLTGEGKTGQSIIAVVLEQTAVWAYERLYPATYIPSTEGIEPGANDFEFSDLRDGNTTLYLIIPPDYLTEYRNVLRVFTGMAMRELRRSYDKAAKEKPAVLFLLDEFPQLGHMQPIEDALLYLAGYGVRFWFFVQDVSQLKRYYPKTWRTFFANTGTQSFFGVSDIETANLVSEMSGTTTVENRQYGTNVGQTVSEGGAHSTGTNSQRSSGWGPGGGTSSNSTGDNESFSTNWSTARTAGLSSQLGYTARRLLLPDEVLRLHDEEQLLFMRWTKPIRASNIPYYLNEEYARRSGIEPPFPVDFD